MNLIGIITTKYQVDLDQFNDPPSNLGNRLDWRPKASKALKKARKDLGLPEGDYTVTPYVYPFASESGCKVRIDIVHTGPADRGHNTLLAK